ncbi:MAG: type II secretion system F family protein [Acidimicrobiia bacterium]|nr:type II secretion system F family protein [Acidimicrobiia bacterium]
MVQAALLGGVDPMLAAGGVLVLLGMMAAFMIESATREVEEDEQESLLNRLRSGVGEAADRRLERTGFAASTRVKLEVVGATMKPAEFFGIVILAGLGLAVILGFLLGGFTPILGLVVGPVFALMILNRKVRKSRQAFEDQLPEMLQLLGGTLRAGMSFVQALSAVGHESPPPAKEELRKVLTENRLGRGFVESLRDVAIRMDSDDFSWVVSAVEVHEDVGGNLADVLDRVAQTIRARNRVRGQVRALSAEGRMSGLVMSLLPPGVVGLMFVTNREYVAELTKSSLGHTLIAIAVGLLLVGSFWLRKMAQFRF